MNKIAQFIKNSNTNMGGKNRICRKKFTKKT